MSNDYCPGYCAHGEEHCGPCDDPLSLVPHCDPAFPVQDAASFQYHGMTLRDYFATQALVGIGTWCPGSMSHDLRHDIELKARASWAYQQADAMLSARKQGDA